MLETVESPLGMITRLRTPGSIEGMAPGWTTPPVAIGTHPLSWPD